MRSLEAQLPHGLRAKRSTPSHQTVFRGPWTPQSGMLGIGSVTCDDHQEPTNEIFADRGGSSRLLGILTAACR